VGGWLLVTGLVFSYMAGIIHPYYTVALAPALAALVGIGAVTAWRARRRLLVRAALAASVLATTAWADVLLNRSAGWLPWLRVVIVACGVAAAAVIIAEHWLGGPARMVLGSVPRSRWSPGWPGRSPTAWTPRRRRTPVRSPRLARPPPVRSAGRAAVLAARQASAAPALDRRAGPAALRASYQAPATAPGPAPAPGRAPARAPARPGGCPAARTGPGPARGQAAWRAVHRSPAP
jgi:4-amino-4-deoxy-L-arabinose transferase-like glycosyltransferase